MRSFKTSFVNSSNYTRRKKKINKKRLNFVEVNINASKSNKRLNNLCVIDKEHEKSFATKKNFKYCQNDFRNKDEKES